MARVSIVTISFNQAKYLERALLSVLQQDHKDLEYIVVDAGSNDGSREIIERYRPGIAKIIFQPDNGPAQGLNRGFAAATGDIFGYINADDAYLPGAIAKAVTSFRNYPFADVISGHSYIVDGEGRMIRRARSVPFDLRLYAYGAVVVMQQSTFFSRRAFSLAGGFNENNHSSWDGELLVDLARCGCNFSVVEDYWSLYAVYPGSITAAIKANARFQEDRARMFRTIMGRRFAKSDQVRVGLARLEKWLRNPLVPLHRLQDRWFSRAPFLPTA